MYTSITMGDLKKLIDKNGDYVLVDVREKEELEYGMIPTAKSIPLSEFEEAVKDLEPAAFKEKYGFERFGKEDNVIFYCLSGSRSASACEVADDLGYKVKNYGGSVMEWSQEDPQVKLY